MKNAKVELKKEWLSAIEINVFSILINGVYVILTQREYEAIEKTL